MSSQLWHLVRPVPDPCTNSSVNSHSKSNNGDNPVCYAAGSKGGPELMGCVRCTLRLLERRPEEELAQSVIIYTTMPHELFMISHYRWCEEMEQLSMAIEVIQDKLFIN